MEPVEMDQWKTELTTWWNDEQEAIGEVRTISETLKFQKNVMIIIVLIIVIIVCEKIGELTVEGKDKNLMWLGLN